MQRWIFAFLSLALIGAGCANATNETEDNTMEDEVTIEQVNLEDGDYMLDTEKSVLEWSARKIVGSAHYGTVDIVSGDLQVTEGNIVGGEFTIDMTTITNSDLENQNLNDQLVTHLNSDDFFNVEEYPEATFSVTSSSDMNLTGNLTIKGITNEVSFPYSVTQTEDDTWLFETIFEIDRSLWDVRFGSGSFFEDLGDDAIRDEIEYALQLEFTMPESLGTEDAEEDTTEGEETETNEDDAEDVE